VVGSYRGWYLGGETFRNKLLAMVDGVGGKGKNRRKAEKGAARDHGESEALRLIREAGKRLGLETSKPMLAKMRKGDSRKVLIAALLRKRTAVGVNWIAERLEMGHQGSLSRLLGKAVRDTGFKKQLVDLEKILLSGDWYHLGTDPNGTVLSHFSG